jgi:TPR repeat protein
MIDLPKCRDEIDPKDYHVDGTPDGNYALRILKFYRELAKTKWIIEGDHEKAKALYDAMNEHQDQRAKELDEAIKILEKALHHQRQTS